MIFNILGLIAGPLMWSTEILLLQFIGAAWFILSLIGVVWFIITVIISALDKG